MCDLVERLRKVEAVERELAHDCDMPPEGTANWEYAETCKEAAARIEQLEAALREISDCKTFTDRKYMIDIARAALEERT